MDQLGAFMNLDLAVRSSVVIALVWLGTIALRRWAVAAATRHLAWVGGMVALLLLPAFAALLPDLPLPILGGGIPGTLTPYLSADPRVAAASAAASSGASWAALLYAGVAALLLARAACARWVLARLWSSATDADPCWRDLLEARRAALRLRRGVTLRLSDRPVVPMTWGTFAPKVLLPSDARRWPAERRHLVLMHELAHVSRFDSLSRTAASLVCVLYWFNPLIWFAAREMTAEQEHATDEAVLAAGAQSLTYARCLLDLAENVGHQLRGCQAAAAMEGGSQLERRIVAILEGGGRSGSRRHAAAVGSAVLATAWLVSTAVPVSPIDTVGSSGAGAAAGSKVSAYPLEVGTARMAMAVPEPAARPPVPDRIPSGTPTLPSGAARSAHGQMATARASSGGDRRWSATPSPQAHRARPPIGAVGATPPSRSGGLSGVPASQPLSPAGVPSRGRAGDGPWPPQPDFSP